MTIAVAVSILCYVLAGIVFTTWVYRTKGKEGWESEYWAIFTCVWPVWVMVLFVVSVRETVGYYRARRYRR